MNDVDDLPAMGPGYDECEPILSEMADPPPWWHRYWVRQLPRRAAIVGAVTVWAFLVVSRAVRRGAAR